MKHNSKFDPLAALVDFDKNSAVIWSLKSNHRGKTEGKNVEQVCGRIFLSSKKSDDTKIKKLIGDEWLAWQKHQYEASANEAIVEIQGQTGPIWWLRPHLNRNRDSGHEGQLVQTKYSVTRDLIGEVARRSKNMGLRKLKFELPDHCGKDEFRGLVVGFEMASYLFKDQVRQVCSFPTLWIIPNSKNKLCSEKLFQEARNLGIGVNLARHLVNMPAGILNPTTYAKWIQIFFKSFAPRMKVSVLKGDELEKEGFRLLSAVGKAAKEGPCVVHFKYRPTGGKKTQKPLAFVGKGVTFDSGGLDIKPPGPMRNMKKDMGGAASLTGFAYWLVTNKFSGPCDIYLALAENSISQEAFRPGDIIESRSGQTVEIHNTDAEGRLVLADVLDYAVKQTGKDAPRQVIDVATLTGAMRVALGADIGGFFTNDESLAKTVREASKAAGDFVWRLPLVGAYEGKINSSVGDLVNAVDGFGGAITAALFLEKFVMGLPWVHMDVYAWKDFPSGPFSQPGGNGQGVQLLAELVTRSSK